MAGSEFELHPRLSADTIFVADWPLSRLLLMNDARYSWLVLVPRRITITEVHDLGPSDRILLIEELARASTGLKVLTGAAKINIGALGNIVPQLHIHVVARFPDDPAWPDPVWGRGHPEPYQASQAELRVAELRVRL